MVVNYDQEAFSKALDYLASSHQAPATARTTKICFFRHFLAPRKGAKYVFLGRLILFRPFMHARGCMRMETTGFNQNNTEDFEKLSVHGIGHACNHTVVYRRIIYLHFFVAATVWAKVSLAFISSSTDCCHFAVWVYVLIA